MFQFSEWGLKLTSISNSLFRFRVCLFVVCCWWVIFIFYFFHHHTLRLPRGHHRSAWTAPHYNSSLWKAWSTNHTRCVSLASYHNQTAPFNVQNRHLLLPLYSVHLQPHGSPQPPMMVVYPECFAWKASLHATHLAAWTLRRCVTADRTVWTGQMRNTVVRINTVSRGRWEWKYRGKELELFTFYKHCRCREVGIGHTVTVM